MYSIYYGDTCFYNDQYPLQEYKLIDPTLDLEANAAGVLTFGLPLTNRLYTPFSLMIPNVKVRRNGKLIWEGRGVSEDINFQGTRTITCEGELAYFNDTCQPQKEYRNTSLKSFFTGVISEHNSKVEASKQFIVGDVTVEDPMTDSYRYTQFEKTMETINTLVETYGGYLKIRRDEEDETIRYIDWLTENELPDATQTIEFGVNLTDFTKSFDMTELATAVLPLGKTLATAGSISVGEQLDFGGYDNWSGYYVTTDQETSGGPYFVNVHDDASSSYKMCIYEGHGDLSGKTFFLSCRNISGNIMYVWCGLDPDTNRYIAVGSVKKAGTGEGTTDMLQEKITAPEGAIRLVICGFGDDIPIALYDVAEVTEKLDKYVTVEEVKRKYIIEDVEYETTPIHQSVYDALPDATKNNGILYQTDDTYKLFRYGSDFGSTLYVRNETAVSNYGWIEKQITWSDVEDPEELYELAELYLTDEQFNQCSLEISAVDMVYLGANVEMINLLDKIHATSDPHGMDHTFPVTKMSLKLDRPDSSIYNLGDDVTPTLTSVNNDINEELAKKISAVPSISDNVQAAMEGAASLISHSTGGHVTLVKDQTGDHVQEIVISEYPDYLSPADQRVWRWNSSGLMHSPHGYNGTYSNAAITMNGEIVADAITTGTMSADRVRGGSLELGIINNVEGKLEVYDNNDTAHRVAAVDRYGVESASYSGNVKTWAKLQNGTFIAGRDSNPAFGEVSLNTDLELEGQDRHCLRLNSDAILLMCDFLGVRDKNTDNIEIARDTSIDVVTAVDFSNQSVTKQRLRFRRGILIEVTNL